MSNLVEFAQNELNILLKSCTDSESLKMQKVMNDDIMEIVKKFASQGHSGFSAQYALNLVTRLLQYKPITPLTGEDEEWVELDYGDDLAYQNKRCPQIFKQKDGKIYDVEGKVFSSDNGHSWYTSKDSRVYIEMPYNVPARPESVIIDNKEQREAILTKIIHIIESIQECKFNYTEITEDTQLNKLLPENKFKELENKLIDFYCITKPIYNLVDFEDIQMYSVISFVMESDKEELVKSEE